MRETFRFAPQIDGFKSERPLPFLPRGGFWFLSALSRKSDNAEEPDAPIILQPMRQMLKSSANVTSARRLNVDLAAIRSNAALPAVLIWHPA
ncbi:hypothetical protein R3X27_24945 [Tropicimonas sp. TH_r6]|uniref:hypothetical protein n=1 Tax=Tropicimonas sp. TH_r6 TaxID=3082085 RepID=UPI0029543FC4|nr:hypothetical protein [Tropicimonas sp. TH_r6]MDV7145937.1 hypothetical protein [Tropicimonas sp. TH_r6]